MATAGVGSEIPYIIGKEFKGVMLINVTNFNQSALLGSEVSEKYTKVEICRFVSNVEHNKVVIKSGAVFLLGIASHVVAYAAILIAIAANGAQRVINLFVCLD